jgi:hypothetical protein
MGWNQAIRDNYNIIKSWRAAQIIRSISKKILFDLIAHFSIN